MKKFFSLFILLLSFGFLFFACAATGISSNADPSGGAVSGNGTNIEIVEADVKYIKSTADFSPSSGAGQNPCFVLKSTAERDNYVNSRKAEVGADMWELAGGPALASALNAYAAGFFAENNLVMVLCTEPSGSTRHKVEKAAAVKDNVLNITINRTGSEMGTTDMAYWHILIPVKKSDFEGDKVSVRVGTVQQP